MASSKTDAEATFALNLEGNIGEKSAEDLAALEQLRQTIAKSTDAIRQASAANRALRGTSDTVKDARAQLKALIDSEKDSVSAANVALLKQGVTYEKIAQDAKKLGEEEKKLKEGLKAKGIEDAKKQSDQLGKAIHLAGGPVEELKSRFDALKGVLGGSAAGMAAVTLVVAGLVAAIAAATAGGVALAASISKWIVTGADAARNMNILRLAMTGTAQNAKNLGTQVDDLAGKLSTPKEDLNALAAGLGRTRLSGQAIVDTFNTVGRASDAMGDDVGSSLKDIITRGQQFNRFQLNPLELQGKGISFGDVAGELAKNLHIGIGDAQQALVQGRLTIDQGAKALRKAVEKNFTSINDAKLLSIDAQILKFKEDLSAMTKGFVIEPLLRGFAELRQLFSQSSVVGVALKGIVTQIGDSIGATFNGGLPSMKAFIEQATIAALKLDIAFLQTWHGVRDNVKSVTGSISDLGKALERIIATDFGSGATDPMIAMQLSLKAISLAVKGVEFALVAANAALFPFIKGLSAVTSIWGATGRALGLGVSGGVAAGIKQGAPEASDATKELAKKVQTEFADALKIHSPSRVFVEYGENTAEGYEQGVRSGAEGASDATGSLGGGAPSSPSSGASGAASGGGGGGSSLSVSLGGIHLHGVSADAAKGMQAKLQAPSFLADLTKAVQDVLKGAGIPTQIAAAT